MQNLPNLLNSINFILDKIREAELKAGRTTNSVALVLVSKGQTIDNIIAAHAFGQNQFAENYVKEALTKMTLTEGLLPPIRWHFIGRIQSNKIHDIAKHFDWVHSVASLAQAKHLNQARPSNKEPLNVCIQVHIPGVTHERGILAEDLLEIANTIKTLPNLALRGLMCLLKPGLTSQQQHEGYRLCHEALASLKAHYQGHTSGLETLSMGMSEDFETAIAEGATIVRIGTAIFGSRPTQQEDR